MYMFMCVYVLQLLNILTNTLYHLYLRVQKRFARRIKFYNSRHKKASIYFFMFCVSK